MNILKNTVTELRQLADQMEKVDMDFRLPDQGMTISDAIKIIRANSESGSYPYFSMHIKTDREAARVEWTLCENYRHFPDKGPRPKTLDELIRLWLESKKPEPEWIDPIPELDAAFAGAQTDLTGKI